MGTECFCIVKRIGPVPLNCIGVFPYPVSQLALTPGIQGSGEKISLAFIVTIIKPKQGIKIKTFNYLNIGIRVTNSPEIFFKVISVAIDCSKGFSPSPVPVAFVPAKLPIISYTGIIGCIR